MTQPEKPNRLPWILAIGCFALAVVSCLVPIGAYLTWRYYVAEAARSHTTSFLYSFVAHDYPTAFTTSISQYDTDLYSVDTFTTCFSATPLATISAADCTDTSVELDGSFVDVTCTVTTPTGPTIVTVGVNHPTDHPYNGFVWLSPDAAVGPAWHSDACATWSGRDYFREPPSGRVRP